MKRIPIVVISTALITGAILFFGTCGTNPQKAKPDKTEFLIAKEKLEYIDKNYNTVFDSLEFRSDSLETVLAQTKSKLKAAKLKQNESQITISILANKETDSLNMVEQLRDCDSLKAQTLAYVNLVDSTNYLYEATIFQLQNLVATKDSQIVICNNSYLQLKGLLDENLVRERKLTDDLNTTYKSQRKKVLQNKLLAGGFLFLSGIATTLYINSNK